MTLHQVSMNLQNNWNVKNLAKCYNVIKYYHFLRFCTFQLFYRTRVYLMKGRVVLFQPETTVIEFYAFNGVYLKIFHWFLEKCIIKRLPI